MIPCRLSSDDGEFTVFPLMPDGNFVVWGLPGPALLPIKGSRRHLSLSSEIAELLARNPDFGVAVDVGAAWEEAVLKAIINPKAATVLHKLSFCIFHRQCIKFNYQCPLKLSCIRNNLEFGDAIKAL